MAFLSGKNNNFRFAFSKTFIPQEIEDKYSPILNRIPGNMCESVLDFINYSIKSVNIQLSPNGYDVIMQRDRGTPYDRMRRSNAFPDTLLNKDLTITFQLDQAYIIWSILNEVFMYYYCSGEDKFIPPFPGMEILDCYNKVMYRVDFIDVLFTSVSGLEFDFSSDSVEQKTIETTWKVSKVDINFEPSRI
jgi:hypothetical protein